MIEILGLYKSFDQHLVLEDINLFIQEGEIFGIIGKSGAGKSTLLRCINLLERPTKGEVFVNHQDLTQLNDYQLRQARFQMGMIFQHFNLLASKTVYENIALPMRIQGIHTDLIDAKITELLEVVELTEKINAYPAQLSGGQKQRVAIARALSTSPKILLCDEATSALDPSTTESILALLKKINTTYGITIVLITHEMNVIKRICNRLALMSQGKIVEVNALSTLISEENSEIKQLLMNDLCPELPLCLSTLVNQKENDRPLIKLYFEGKNATIPFISQMSRELSIDINILLANIDRCDGITYGIVIAELAANQSLLSLFMSKCASYNLSVEVLGYVHDAAQ